MSLAPWEAGFAPRKLRGFAVDSSSFESVPRVWEFAYESCVVALDKSCGREGAREWAIEWAVDGRELSTPSCGRGGSGGGDSSCEASELVDVLREKLRIMPSVGLAKSCVSTWLLSAAFLVARVASLLFCVGVEGGLPCPDAAGD